MPLPKALLDTDTLSAAMRGTPPVLAKARDYLAEHGTFSFSIITRYDSSLRPVRMSGAESALADSPSHLDGGDDLLPTALGAQPPGNRELRGSRRLSNGGAETWSEAAKVGPAIILLLTFEKVSTVRLSGSRSQSQPTPIRP
jgi:hypothetical protein